MEVVGAHLLVLDGLVGTREALRILTFSNVFGHPEPRRSFATFPTCLMKFEHVSENVPEFLRLVQVFENSGILENVENDEAVGHLAWPSAKVQVSFDFVKVTKIVCVKTA